MAVSERVRLARGVVAGYVLPQEGGVLERLFVDGRPVLAAMPWADEVEPALVPAADEESWVAHWRGGWQLCFPSAGQLDSASAWPQGFHGVASQAPWRVVEADDEQVALEWRDDDGLVVARKWRLTDVGAEVVTTAENRGTRMRPLVIAEHLVLGGDIVAPVLTGGGSLEIDVPGGGALAQLDYFGVPMGEQVPWPAAAVDRWACIDAATPARVGAIVDPVARRIVVRGRHVTVEVYWEGLPHALLWEELARSTEHPWNGAVAGVGIEPTSAPHGLGTARGDGTIMLLPGSSFTWSTSLSIRWTPEETP